MAKKRSEGRRIQQAVEMGEANARLIPKIQGWCRHLEIKQESAGLVAEMYQLPIGMMRISCPHASGGGIISMHLSHVATHFITENCRNCSHHQLVSLDNIGREILDREEEVKARLVIDENHAKQAKLKLRELVSGDLTKALRTENVTAQSVLELVALLDNETTQVEAANKLTKAAELAPEFFTPLAVEVICSYFPEPQHGELCMDVVLRLNAQTQQFPEVAFLAAKTCLEKAKNQDKACFLIGHYWQAGNPSPDAELVENIITTRHHHDWLERFETGSFEGRDFALTVVGEQNSVMLAAILKQQLVINDKNIRINASTIIRTLSKNFPPLAQELTDSLIDSLELDDDIYEASADGAARRTLAIIYMSHPEFTHEKINEGYKRLSAEGKEIIIRVFREIIWEAKDFHKNTPNLASPFRICIPKIIPFLLQIIGGFAHPVNAKVEATGILGTAAEYLPEYFDDHLDSLLGSVATLVHERVFFSEKKASGILEEMNRQGQMAVYSRATSDLVNAIKKLSDQAPRKVLVRLKEIIPNLESDQTYNAAYKAELTGIYGELGQNPEYLPEVIPELYKLLVDFTSPLVRGSAIKAITKVVEKNREALPQNMIDLLIVYLTDTYVYVHKSTIRLFQYLTPGSEDEAFTIIHSLLHLNKCYEDDHYFREEIVRALVHISWQNKSLLQKIAAPVIVEHCQSPEHYPAQDALKEFTWLLDELPEKFKTIFAREVVSFLKRFERDRYNDETFSDRYRFWLHLFDSPREAITQNLSNIREAAQEKAKSDPWEALRFVQLLSYFEMHDEAVALARQIEAAQAATKHNEVVIGHAQLAASAMNVEALLGSEQLQQAINELEQATKLAEEQCAYFARNSSRDTLAAFTVADEIADSLR